LAVCAQRWLESGVAVHPVVELHDCDVELGQLAYPVAAGGPGGGGVGNELAHETVARHVTPMAGRQQGGGGHLGDALARRVSSSYAHLVTARLRRRNVHQYFGFVAAAGESRRGTPDRYLYAVIEQFRCEFNRSARRGIKFHHHGG